MQRATTTKKKEMIERENKARIAKIEGFIRCEGIYIFISSLRQR